MEGLKATEDRAMAAGVGLILGSLRGRGDVGSKIGLEEMANSGGAGLVSCRGPLFVTAGQRGGGGGLAHNVWGDWDSLCFLQKAAVWYEGEEQRSVQTLHSPSLGIAVAPGPPSAP